MGALKLIQRKYNGVRGLIDFWGLVRDPKNTNRIFEMTQHMKDSMSAEQLAEMLKVLYTDPEMEKEYQAQYWPDVPSYDVLKSYPEGSFGRAYADFLDQWKLDKDLFPAPKFGDRSDYLTSRIYQSHDFWHVLTGYTPDLVDELALQAFGVAQYGQPLSVLILSGGLIHILQNHHERGVEALAAVTKGYERGLKAKNLLTSFVLDRLGEPLEEVRKDLNLSAN